MSVIRERHPDHAILAEELPGAQPDAQGVWPIPAGMLWMVDPLDGTTNYTTGLPLSCVSVGVARDGQPLAGAIYDPYRDELFLGVRGQGATLNGRPLPPIVQKDLAHAVVGLDWMHEPRTRQTVVGYVTVLATNCLSLRALGSAALALAYVAAGRLQLYLNLGLQPWDVAAAAVLLGECGASLSHVDGTAWHLGEPGVIAGHSALLNSAVDLLRQA